jgi:hypothetical protein
MRELRAIDEALRQGRRGLLGCSCAGAAGSKGQGVARVFYARVDSPVDVVPLDEVISKDQRQRGARDRFPGHGSSRSVGFAATTTEEPGGAEQGGPAREGTAPEAGQGSGLQGECPANACLKDGKPVPRSATPGSP